MLKVNFEITDGEVHALMGENGAGKSTLMKILFGYEKCDKGTIEYKGNKVEINNPNQAIGMGIGMVNQHFMLVDNLKVYENIVLGIEPNAGLFLDKKKAIEIQHDFYQKHPEFLVF